MIMSFKQKKIKIEPRIKLNHNIYTPFRMLSINNFQIDGAGGNVNTVCTPDSMFQIPYFRQLVGSVFCQWKD